MTSRYRKKPVVVEAMQWQGGDTTPLARFVGSQNWTRADTRGVPWTHKDTEEVVVWNEPEQAWIPTPVGHWIIRGVQGEFYPCEPGIFDATYEAVDPATEDRPEDVPNG